MKKVILVCMFVALAVPLVPAQPLTSMYQSFETAWTNGGTTPSGWTKTNVVGTADWGQKVFPLTGLGAPKAGAAHQGRAAAWFPAGSVRVGTTTRLESPVFDFSAATRVRLRFFLVNKRGVDTLTHDTLRVSTSSDGGATWNTAKTVIDSTASDGTWKQIYAVLDAVAGKSNVKIAFEAVADSNGRDIWIDRVVVQYPSVSVRQIQEVPSDSLLVSDNLQNTLPARGVLQYSPYSGDTLTVTALCVVPYKILTFTARGWTMLLYDTSSTSQWKGLFTRVNPADSAKVILDGFTNVAAGDIITLVGVVSEFPTDMNSVTQLQPIGGNPITVIGSGALPKAVHKNVSDFYTGIFSGGIVHYSTGEPYEGMFVELTNLALNFKVNTGRGTFSAVDQSNNEITMYDASRYFTVVVGSVDHPGPDSIWAKVYAGLGVGVRIDTIRGFITTVSGQESPRGYRIAPVYYGDIVFGLVPPSISTHRRNPVVVTPDSVARISVKAAQQTGGAAVVLVRLLHSINNGPFVIDTMTFNASDTTYNAQIPQQPADTFVKYFIQATDAVGAKATLASSAIGGFSSDTSKGLFFYTSLARPVTIRDVQYTPYANGRSGYLGAVVTLKGIVTGDTAHIGISPLNAGGSNAWYMQSGNQPWSAIWVTGADTTLKKIRNGDSVSVTGTVLENFDVTMLGSVATPVSVLASGLSEPTPVNLSTSAFGPNVGNGFASAEPYEGMLVKFRNLTVTDTTAWVFSDPTEFAVADSTGSPILVRRDGRNTYTNIPAESTSTTPKKVLRPGNKIASLTGVIYYSFNRYKVLPRNNADYGSVTSVDINRESVVPALYALGQNYPNPFNPSTLIVYDLPTAGLVTVKIYNILGQEVRTLLHEVQTAGRYTVRFNGTSLPSGVYFYSLQSGTFTQVKKMLMIK